jgi:hypothetical protein
MLYVLWVVFDEDVLDDVVMEEEVLDDNSWLSSAISSLICFMAEVFELPLIALIELLMLCLLLCQHIC